MNKLDLVRSAVDRLELSRKDAVALIDGVFDDIQAAVVAGEPVKIPGFGQFKVRDRAARMARNPATGEQVKVPAKRVFKFLPAKALKEAVMSKRGARGGALARRPASKAPARKAAARKATASQEALEAVRSTTALTRGALANGLRRSPTLLSTRRSSMRRLSLALSALRSAALSPDARRQLRRADRQRRRGIPPANRRASSTRVFRVPRVCFDYSRTPAHPPPRRHRITSAERARARAGGWQPVASVPPWTNGPRHRDPDDQRNRHGLRITARRTGTSSRPIRPATTSTARGPRWPRCRRVTVRSTSRRRCSPDGKLIVNGGEYNFLHTVETNSARDLRSGREHVDGRDRPQRLGRDRRRAERRAADGTYMIGNCCSSVQALLNESTMAWTQRSATASRTQ